MKRRVVLALSVGLLASVSALAPAASALAATTPTVQEVASALGQSPVYNQPDAELALSSGDAGALTSQAKNAGTPIFIAVVSQAFVDQNGGTATKALTAIHDQLGLSGTYAIIGGKSFRAKSTEFDVSQVADQAFANNKSNGAYAVLSAFVSGVSDLAASGGTGTGTGTGTGKSSGSGLVIIGMLLVVLAAAGGLGFWAYRNNKKTQAAQLVVVGNAVSEDVTDLGDKLAAVDTHNPALEGDGAADLGRALDSYNAARLTLDTMKSAADAGRATKQLEDGRYYLACVQARIDGKPLPERRPPCFFDPRHGPSVQDADWAPPGGAARPVPVCAACATMLATGEHPVTRQVQAINGQYVPYYAGGQAYASYGRGYYDSFGSVLPWLFVAGAFNQPHTTIVNNYGSGFDGGGDAGGGSGFFGGGGDFGGGGGWGGGDFGGGGDGGGNF